MTYDPNADPAMAAFAAIGTPVPASEVPALVRAGVTVYAFGYGDGTEVGFDALDEGDLWAWSDPEIGADVVASWAPFATERDAADIITNALMLRDEGTERDAAEAIMAALTQAGFVVLNECARCHEDPRAHWCADLEETFNR